MKLLVAAVCASVLLAGMVSARTAMAAEPSEAVLQKKLTELKKKNAQLKADLSRKKAESFSLFTAATNAENAAGLRGLSCHGVSNASVPDPGYPVNGVVHARLKVKRATFSLSATFAAAKPIQSFRLYAGTCNVAKQ